MAYGGPLYRDSSKLTLLAWQNTAGAVGIIGCASITRRERLVKTLIFGALLTMSATTAYAGQHYVEVWNPPEARVTRPSNTAREHNPAKKRPQSLKLAPYAKHRAVMKSVAAPLPAVAPEDRVPTFNDIPRKRTPEGNVLRVNDRLTAVRVQR